MIVDRFKTFMRSFLVLVRAIEPPDYICTFVHDHPTDDEIYEGLIYVVGGKGYQKWAYFRCPTDSNEIIQLSLMEKHRPRWRVKADWLQRPTINPSVRQTEGSYAHFWVRCGKVDLCMDSGMKIAPDQNVNGTWVSYF